MWHTLDNVEKFIDSLVVADEQLAEVERRKGCQCGGRLHRADYPRKARGVPGQWDRAFAQRFSFCCAERECRRRRTPPSLRFFGRRVYVAAVVVACCATTLPTTRAVAPRRTVDRWRQFFRHQFVDSRFWHHARAWLMPPVREDALPGSLVERFAGDWATRMYQTLRFLAPITTFSAGSPMEG